MLSLLARRRAGRSTVTAGGAGGAAGSTPVYRVRARLLTVTTVDAATAVVARAAAADGRDLGDVTAAWAARTPNPITRARSRGEGRDLLAAASETCPGLEVGPMPLPVAAGVVAARTGLEADALARLIGYDEVQGMLADNEPADTLVWTQALLPQVRSLAAQVSHLTDPARIPATGADIAAAAS